MTNITEVAIGIALLAIGICGMRTGWRRLDAAHTQILEDVHRIVIEKPEADLDSDFAFTEHNIREKAWVVVLAISVILIICGGGLMLANLT